MFKEIANTTFNNVLFNCPTIPFMHESMKRLYEEAERLAGVTGQSNLARYLNQSPQVVKNWEKRGVSKDGLKAAFERLRADSDYLMSGVRKTPVDPDANIDQNLKKVRSIHGEVPKISWVKAGELCDVEDFLEPGDAIDWLICPVKHGERTFALQVDGPSMDTGNADGYPDGYDIFIDPDIEPKNGDDVVVRTPTGKATFKRLQITQEGNLLIALNPDWPNRIIPVPEGTIICGVVIYSGRPRRK